MITEIGWNKIGRDIWFEAGVSLSKTEYHPKYGYVLTIAFGLFSIYFRWNRTNR